MPENLLQGRRKLSKAGWASSNVGGQNLPPLVKIELTSWPSKTWVGICPPCPPYPPISYVHVLFLKKKVVSRKKQKKETQHVSFHFLQNILTKVF